MTTHQHIPITDDRGKMLIPWYDDEQPLPGSVVLRQGLHGTAIQRFFSDGQWHEVGSNRVMTWEQVMTERNLVLVYDAAERAR